MSEELKKKRKRIHLSCLKCARAKRKCCKKLPCDNCRVRNLVCEYEDGANPQVVQFSRSRLPETPAILTENISESRESAPFAHPSSNVPLQSVSSQSRPPVSATGSTEGHPHQDKHRQSISSTNSQLFTQPVVYSKDSIDESPSTNSHNYPSTGSVTSEGYPTPVNPIPKASSTNLYVNEIDGQKARETGMVRDDQCGPPNFVLRQGLGYQRMESRYYGPSSGPSLLFFHTPYMLPYQRRERFPKETIPGFEEILEAYKQKLHWNVACFDWTDLLKWLDSDNILVTNKVIYLVLALGSLVSNRMEDAAEFEARSRIDSDVSCTRFSSPCNTELLLLLLRSFYYDLKGQQEVVWLLLNQGIARAVSMGYHRDWVREEQIMKGARLPEHRVRRARVWNTFLEFQYKYSLMLGRPYSVPPRMADSPRIVVATGQFSVEKSFRDFLNLLAPLYREFVDELLMPESGEKNYTNLLQLDQKISAWWFEVIKCYGDRLNEPLYSDSMLEALPINEDQSLEDRIVRGQFWSLAVYRLFLRSRMHREILQSPDPQKSAYSTEQFYQANKSFTIMVKKLLDMRISHGLTDLTGFAIDNLLYYTMRSYVCNDREKYPFRSYATETAERLEDILRKVASLGSSMSSIAQNSLDAAAALKNGRNISVIHPLVAVQETPEQDANSTDTDEYSNSTSSVSTTSTRDTSHRGSSVSVGSSNIRGPSTQPDANHTQIMGQSVNDMVNNQTNLLDTSGNYSGAPNGGVMYSASFDLGDWTGILADKTNSRQTDDFLLY